MLIVPSKANVVGLTALLVTLTGLPALADPVETPDAFVHRVYARYRTSAAPGVPMDRPGGAAFYTTTLLDAFAKDSALAHGEIGAIDYDPICSCQAYGPLRVKTVTMTGGAPDMVKARVTFDNLSYHETVVLTLSRTTAGWRIADIGDRNRTSVMAVLRESNAHPMAPEAPAQK